MPTRRQFIATSALGLTAIAGEGCAGDPAGPGVGGGEVSGTQRIPLMSIGATVAVNGLGLGGQGVAVTRLTTTAVVAVSRQCTHQGCTVGLPGSPGANMQCPCHGSVYTTQGQVVNGPAPAALKGYGAVIDTGTNEVEVTVP